MKQSTSRIVTTHVGSLARPPALFQAMRALDEGASSDRAGYETMLKREVADVVRRQVEAGIDVVSDGEYSKPGFAVYVNSRLGGYTTRQIPRASPWADSREAREFPEFYGLESRTFAGTISSWSNQMICTGPVTYKGQDLLSRDLVNLKAAVAAAGAAEAFVPSISPIDVVSNQRNEYYRTDDEFLYAVADALRVEYKAIVDAGFVLQIDDPRLSSHYVSNPGLTVKEVRRWAASRIEAINHALSGIPEDRVRYHTCYGINMGPRVHDLELRHVIDIILKIKAGAYSFEAANQRHDHEWRLWEDVKLPNGKSLIPGCITHASVLVEHPQLVADRILRYASVVGRENVIAGADCGFGTQASSSPEIHPTIVWAKFRSLVEGAKLASKELWKRTARKAKAKPARRTAQRPRRRAGRAR
ncbi:MAG TPA: cobalamin-independent methionine synthase II family protein [Alphaproteobacteria bacterium]